MDWRGFRWIVLSFDHGIHSRMDRMGLLTNSIPGGLEER